MSVGGTLPARIFHSFMSGAEETMPVRPLAGSNIMASAQAPDSIEQPSTAPVAEKPDTLQKLLNGIFGGT